MENNLWLVVGKCSGQLAPIPDVPENGHHLGLRIVCAQLQVDFIKRALRSIIKD
jgi:hypothetical protein